ncbi:hypothetical protein [Phyllobacterium sp. K27]
MSVIMVSAIGSETMWAAWHAKCGVILAIIGLGYWLKSSPNTNIEAGGGERETVRLDCRFDLEQNRTDFHARMPYLSDNRAMVLR